MLRPEVTRTVCALCVIAMQSTTPAIGLQASTAGTDHDADGRAKPSRVCERVGNVGSPNYKWIAYLRRAEWDEPGYAIPYMLTEVWLRERETGVERRILDYTRLSVKWTRRLKRSPTIFGVAGGFTFRYMSWSPTRTPLRWRTQGTRSIHGALVVIDLQHDRILEVEGMLWSGRPMARWRWRAVAICWGVRMECW
ncbi:MAG: hypothetical protein KatS3mg077_2883 [Candidatus Binatia bacterium]|nr:MAG: hypothetical protein KatS3mg077_2883 [Candidatus Binatia bacterium]